MKTPRFWQYNGFMAKVLMPIAWVYGAVTRWRISHQKPYHSKAKVICIGNITAGGVGKTPVAVMMAQKYLNAGKKVVFLTRGYKGKLKNIVVDLAKHNAVETGDEARLLAHRALTIIAPDRAKGAKMAEALGADVIVMDDGFQNPKLYKDESWLVFDGALGIGNGKIIPAGPLRESLENGERRAQNIIIMGEDKTNLARFCHLPVYFGHLEAEKLELKNKKVFAFAGIGHPNKFYQTLKDNGYDVVLTRDFEDHHQYTQAQFEDMLKEAEEKGLELITTEKDFVKIENMIKDNTKDKIHVLKVKAVIEKSFV